MRFVCRLRSLTIEYALLKPGESVLDVGCGTGGVIIPAKLRVGKDDSAAGIDPAPEMLAIARRKANRAGLEIDFRLGMIESLPFPDAMFDADYPARRTLSCHWLSPRGKTCRAARGV